MKPYSRKTTKNKYLTKEKTEELIAILDEAIAICDDYILESSQTNSDDILLEQTTEMPNRTKLIPGSFFRNIFHKR